MITTDILEYFLSSGMRVPNATQILHLQNVCRSTLVKREDCMELIGMGLSGFDDVHRYIRFTAREQIRMRFMETSIDMKFDVHGMFSTTPLLSENPEGYLDKLIWMVKEAYLMNAHIK